MVNNINDISNPAKVKANFRKYKGDDDAKLELSEKKDKKYKVIHDGKTTHFGSTM
jgi:type IV secretory pathway VirB9-like protein